MEFLSFSKMFLYAQMGSSAPDLGPKQCNCVSWDLPDNFWGFSQKWVWHWLGIVLWRKLDITKSLFMDKRAILPYFRTQSSLIRYLEINIGLNLGKFFILTKYSIKTNTRYIKSSKKVISLANGFFIVTLSRSVTVYLGIYLTSSLSF